MKTQSNTFDKYEYIVLKDQLWLERQLKAGNCVAECLNACEDLIHSPGSNISLEDLECLALSIMKKHNCTPTFKGYEGFPSAVCASINKQVVHGIVNNYTLKDGDVVTIDLGATYEGAIADAARTWIFGVPKEKKHIDLLKACEGALYKAIDAIKIGERLGVIGNAIDRHVKDSGFGSILNYGGHGIEYNSPHAAPFVSNKSSKNEGVRITNGLSIAIEPMLTIGPPKTKILDDNWTVETPGISCHFENSVTILNDKVYIITDTGRRNAY